MLVANNQRLIIFDYLNPSNDWSICQNISAKNKTTGFLQPLVLSINDSQRLPSYLYSMFSQCTKYTFWATLFTLYSNSAQRDRMATRCRLWRALPPIQKITNDPRYNMPAHALFKRQTVNKRWHLSKVKAVKWKRASVALALLCWNCGLEFPLWRAEQLN